MSGRSWYERAAIIPGRASTRSKAPDNLYPNGGGPRYMTSAEGATITAMKGAYAEDYLDTNCALGAVSIGYNERGHELAVGSIGVGSLPHRTEVEAAEVALRDVAPWASHVRFVRTGSEATLGALRIARLATGRRPFYRLHGSYHGWPEPWGGETSDPNAYYFKVGEVPAFRHEPAAVIIEPPRWEEYDRQWLVDVQKATRAAGAVLIFDEMIYGGRWATGGASELHLVYPDLACFGKALGNGSPFAMIVGKDVLADHGTAVSGTYSGDVRSLSAFVQTMADYRSRDVIDWMWKRGKQLRRGLVEVVGESEIEATVEGAPVHQRIRFADEELGYAFAVEMVKRSIFWAHHSTNIMRAHTEADIERVIDAAAASLTELELRTDDE